MSTRKAAKRKPNSSSPTAAGRSGGATTDAAASLPASAPEVNPERPVEADSPRRIRVISPAPSNAIPQTMMGRAIRPFAKPAQSGSFAPFAVAQARRGR